MATVTTDADQHTPACACGWAMPRYTDPGAAHQAADWHARDCRFEPMLGLVCPTCQDHPPYCPLLSTRSPGGLLPLPLLGGCVEPLEASDLFAFAHRSR